MCIRYVPPNKTICFSSTAVLDGGFCPCGAHVTMKKMPHLNKNSMYALRNSKIINIYRLVYK
jgi:hypothetical protein